MPNCRAVLCLPRLDRGHAVLRARRHVAAVVVEAAVAAHAAGDQAARRRRGVASSSASVNSSWRVRHDAELYTHEYTAGNRYSAQAAHSGPSARQSILRGAAAAFAHGRLRGTSMEDVADACGHHAADRLPPLRLEGGPLPGGPRAGLRPAWARSSPTPSRRSGRCSRSPGKTPTHSACSGPTPLTSPISLRTSRTFVKQRSSSRTSWSARASPTPAFVGGR